MQVIKLEMEMDSSSRRRPFDRSLAARDPDPVTLKKPRLITELDEEDSTPFISSVSNGGAAAGRLGFRQTVERDRDSENGYEPQALSQLQIQQQQQELVNQYRTALSELTFNSKPIITNLTIIAGENVHAAKAIAATICNHILEVPSDQKLPSLYLLDSIVKNIGRDYLKYFAARLPEVFCTAYRQVGPVVHSGMRHLFGTWKGVFPPQSLQVIEKELGFQSAANGSSSGLTASRSEPQTQPSAHSIHVNPKYLEARQRLRQSSTENSPTSDTNFINSPDAIERQDRTSTITNAFRQRADPRLKNIQQAQRDAENASIQENDGAPYNDFDYGSDAGFGKSSGIVAEPGYDSSWYGPGSNNMETVPGQRNGFDTKHGFTNILAPKSANAGVKLPSTNNIRGNEVNRSWKNSEEDEYIWDGINSRLANLSKSGSISSRDPRSHPEPEKLGFESRLQKPQGIQHINSRIDREALSDSPSTGVFRHQMPSLRSQGLSLGSSFNGVSASVNSLPKTSLQLRTGSSHIGAPGLRFPPSAMTVQHRHPLRAASSPGQAPTLHRPPTPSVATHNSSRILHSLVGHDRPTTQPHAADNKPTPSRVQKGTGPPSQSSQGSFPVGNSQKQQMHNLTLPIHTKKHEPPSLSPPTKMSVDTNPLIDSSLDHSKPPVISTPLATGNLVASVSGLFGINSRPPLPNVLLPTLSTSPSSKVVASRLSPSSHDTALLSSSTSEKEAGKPSPPPVSSLLSTLVAKGLISASKTDSPVSQSPPVEVPRKTKIPLTDDEPSLSNSDVKSPVNVPQLTTEDIKGIIGFEFKPDIIRRSHPSVISELIVDDLPHQCHICGLRFKLQERFDKHIQWHTLKNPELNTLSKVSRRWFTHSDDWGKEKPEVESSDQTTGPMEIDGELMVVADESQCVCILCGEVFDDFYSQEMDKWLFRKAVYLCIEDGEAEDIVAAHGPIVHEHCISENSLSDLGISNGVKME